MLDLAEERSWGARGEGKGEGAKISPKWGLMVFLGLPPPPPPRSPMRDWDHGEAWEENPDASMTVSKFVEEVQNILYAKDLEKGGPLGPDSPTQTLLQGSLKDAFCNHLKRGFFNIKIKGNHH